MTKVVTVMIVVLGIPTIASADITISIWNLEHLGGNDKRIDLAAQDKPMGLD